MLAGADGKRRMHVDACPCLGRYSSALDAQHHCRRLGQFSARSDANTNANASDNDGALRHWTLVRQDPD